MKETPFFETQLCCELIKGDKVWRLTQPLCYHSNIVGIVDVPAGFETDLASVPRIPLLWLLWGGICHREGVVHDFLYRSDALPLVKKEQADKVFLEAMAVRGKAAYVRYPMYWGVKFGGGSSYHKRKVVDEFEI
jgi:hypothetical protein